MVKKGFVRGVNRREARMVFDEDNPGETAPSSTDAEDRRPL
jgi:hypothetical protein